LGGALAVAITEIPILDGVFSSGVPILLGVAIFVSQVVIFYYVREAWNAYQDYKDILRAGVWNAKQDGIEAEIGKMDASDLND
jgi:hypothetical protein